MKMRNTDDTKINKTIKKIIHILKKNNNLITENIDKNQISKFANTLLGITKLVLKNNISQKQNKLLSTGKITTKILSKKKHSNSHRGGFFFKNIEDKKNEPITGEDISKLLDDIQQFFYYAQYTKEGSFLMDTSVLLDLLRGNTEQFKGYLNYRILPNYYQVYPPFLKWDNIKKAYDEGMISNLPDYLMAYNTWLKMKKEYLVEKGEIPPETLEPKFYDKLSEKLNDEAYKLRKARLTLKGYKPLNLVV
jgi:hypothetical protein